MFNLRMREQMREAVVSQAELQSGRLAGAQPITVGFVDIVGFTQLGEDVTPGGARAGGAGASSARSPTPSTRP